MKKPKIEQLNEWLENPVTLEFKAFIEKELDLNEKSKAEAFYPFEPQKTQEIFANLNGCEDTLNVILSILEGDWDYFREEEHESDYTIETSAEQVGD